MPHRVGGNELVIDEGGTCAAAPYPSWLLGDAEFEVPSSHGRTVNHTATLPAMDIEKAKSALVGLTLAEHLGDMNDEIPILAKALDLTEPEWNRDWERYVFDFEDEVLG
jgi:hypothetical protein